MFSIDVSPELVAFKKRFFKPIFGKFSILRKIGKIIITNDDLECHVFAFLHDFLYCKKTLRKKIKMERHSVDLKDLITNLKGFKMILTRSCSQSTYFKYHDKELVAFCWIPVWTIPMLPHIQFMEMDASFEPSRPFVYSIPLGILTTHKIPLGLVVGPTETKDLYSMFDESLLFLNTEREMLKQIPILSDEGTGIISYGKIYHPNHFFCIFHLIRKFGTNSIISFLVSRVLFIKAEIILDKEIPNILKN
jgi:hypothetical protein